MCNTATTTHNNHPGTYQDLSPAIMDLIQAEVKNCLYYGVQCVTTEKAAELLSVEPDTVRQWIKKGKLMASKPGKDYSIRMSDIDQLLKETAVVVRMDKRFKRQAIWK